MCYSLPCLQGPSSLTPSLPEPPPSICSRRVDDQYPAKPHGSYRLPTPPSTLLKYIVSKTGEGGPFLHLSALYPILCLCASVADQSPILRTHFQVPYPLTPLFATLTKTPGCGGYSSPLGLVPAPCPLSCKLFPFLRLQNANFATPFF